MKRVTALALFALSFFTFTGCGSESNNKAGGGGEPGEAEITIYSGRSKELVGPIIKAYALATKSNVTVKYFSNSSELVNTLKSEGDKTAADVYWLQDVAALGQLAKDGHAGKIPDSVLKNVPKQLQSSTGHWIGTSGRARVLAYNTEKVKPADLPKSVFDLTDSRWKGQVGWAPGNGSFQAFLTGMRLVHGDDKAEAWLKGMIANEAKPYPKNTPIVAALGEGEITLGIPNHYYLLRKKAENPDFPVNQTFFADGDIGNMFLVAGIGITKTAKNADSAAKFINFVNSKEVAEKFVTNKKHFEYPLAKGLKTNDNLQAQDKLEAVAPKVELDKLSDLAGTKALLKKVGL